jgi:hypothetical protein
VSAARLSRIHGLSVREREIARRAAFAAAEYRRWYASELGERTHYPGTTAEQVVEQEMDAGPRRQARVLAVAAAMAREWGVDLTSQLTAGHYRGVP